MQQAGLLCLCCYSFSFPPRPVRALAHMTHASSPPLSACAAPPPNPPENTRKHLLSQTLFFLASVPLQAPSRKTHAESEPPAAAFVLQVPIQRFHAQSLLLLPPCCRSPTKECICRAKAFCCCLCAAGPPQKVHAQSQSLLLLPLRCCRSPTSLTALSSASAHPSPPPAGLTLTQSCKLRGPTSCGRWPRVRVRARARSRMGPRQGHAQPPLLCRSWPGLHAQVCS